MGIEARVATQHHLFERRLLNVPAALRPELAFAARQHAAKKAQTGQLVEQRGELGAQINSRWLWAAVEQGHLAPMPMASRGTQHAQKRREPRSGTGQHQWSIELTFLIEALP